MLYKTSEKRREYSRKYHANHREERNENRKILYNSNIEHELDMRSKYHHSHKQESNSKRKKHYWNNRESERATQRNNWYVANYNITTDQFNEIMVKQNNCCAICKIIQQKNLSVDHNHLNNKIRGLLCVACNTALGKVENWYSKYTDRINKYLLGSIEFIHNYQPIRYKYTTVKERRRESYLIRTYHISHRDFEVLVEKQENKCVICNVVPNKILNIDHNHSTKRVRGLLCDYCNTSLGVIETWYSKYKDVVDNYLKPSDVQKAA